MKFNEIQNKILKAVDDARGSILSASHQIHDHPELGYQEKYAVDLLTSILGSYGFKVDRGIAGIETAFIASKGNPTGRVVGFCAEYDALPELGHACGHNVIATSALAAGIGLGAVINIDSSGQVLVIGTPAEESDGAKAVMVEKGVFKEVDAALMVHPLSKNFKHTVSLALDAIKISFTGKSSHAAVAPWEGVNALDALLLTFTNINALRQQTRPDTRIHGIVSNGGAAPGIIPEHTEGRFYVRAKDRGYLNELHQKVINCAQAAALATGTEIKFDRFENSMDEMVNNTILASRASEYCEALGAATFELAPDSFGSIDMGNVSRMVPGIHLLVDITGGDYAGPHTQKFATLAREPFADEVVIRSGKGLALAGYDVITDDDFYMKIKEEYTSYFK